MDESRLPGGTWLALTAGAATWSTEDQRCSPAHRLVCVLITWDWFIVALSLLMLASRSQTRPWPIAIAGAIAVGVLAFDPVLRAITHPPLTRSAPLNFLLRASALLVVSVAFLALLHGWQRFAVAIVGVAIGADGALTADDLGVPADVRRWWREFMISAFHFGVLGALIGVLLLGNRANIRFALSSYLCLQLAVVVALATTWIVSVVLGREHELHRQIVADVKEDERRRRAHWLHDDICAQIRLISLRLQTDDLSTRAVVHELDELDHSLRLRQLDELFGAGSVRVAEVLQPYIRYAQNMGAQIDSVPAFEQAALVLDETDARRLSHAVSVLMSNALNAGATHLTIELASRHDELRVIVTDNGPGFDADDIQPGRGLWLLHEELGPGGGVEHVSTPGGARVAAIIHLEERSRIVEHLVG